MLETFCTHLGALRANCYIVPLGNGECVVIDIGGHPRTLLSFLREQNLTLRAILLTHGHFDPIGGVEEVREETNCDVFIHENDERMLSDINLNLGTTFNYFVFHPVKRYTTIKDNDILEFENLKFKVLHTPGHTKGSVCFVCDDCIFSGDTLFRLSIGRTDFENGSMSEMTQSLKRLSALEGDFRVMPGHMEESTLGFERANNPFMI